AIWLRYPLWTLLPQSTPSPLRGGIKGGGRLATRSGLSHPLLASPVKGEVSPGGCGAVGTAPQPNLDIPAPRPILPSHPALTGRYNMEFQMNDCLACIAHLESAHARLRFPAPAHLFDAR